MDGLERQHLPRQIQARHCVSKAGVTVHTKHAFSDLFCTPPPKKARGQSNWRYIEAPPSFHTTAWNRSSGRCAGSPPSRLGCPPLGKGRLRCVGTRQTPSGWRTAWTAPAPAAAGERWPQSQCAHAHPSRNICETKEKMKEKMLQS